MIVAYYSAWGHHGKPRGGTPPRQGGRGCDDQRWRGGNDHRGSRNKRYGGVMLNLT